MYNSAIVTQHLRSGFLEFQGFTSNPPATRRGVESLVRRYQSGALQESLEKRFSLENIKNIEGQLEQGIEQVGNATQQVLKVLSRNETSIKGITDALNDTGLLKDAGKVSADEPSKFRQSGIWEVFPFSQNLHARWIGDLVDNEALSIQLRQLFPRQFQYVSGPPRSAGFGVTSFLMAHAKSKCGKIRRTNSESNLSRGATSSWRKSSYSQLVVSCDGMYSIDHVMM